MKSRLTLGAKLALGVAALCATLLALSIVSLRAIGQLGAALDAAVTVTGPSLDLVGATRTAFQDLKDQSFRIQLAYAVAEVQNKANAAVELQAQLSAKAYAATPPLPVEPGADPPLPPPVPVRPISVTPPDIRCAACHTPAPPGETIRALEAAGEAVHRRTRELQRLLVRPESRQAVDTIDRGASSWVDHSRTYLALASGGKFEQAHAVLRDRMMPILGDVDNAAQILAARERQSLADSGAVAKASVGGNRFAALTVIALNAAVAAVLLWLVFGSIRTLRTAVSQVNAGASRVGSAAGQVAADSRSLAQTSAEQAAMLRQTSAAGEQIGAMATSNGRNSTAVAELVTQSLERFAGAKTALGHMVGAMDEIKEQSGKISNIIRVIDDIAFQTNLLALNAAVEAARAGNAGLGFAVVAEEVRNLAQRSAQAAKDTEQLIEETIAKSGEGQSKVNEVASFILGIASDAARIKSLVDQVNAGNDEQTRGLGEIAAAILRMDGLTRRAANAAEHNAKTADLLNTESAALSNVVRQLTVTLGSG